MMDFVFCTDKNYLKGYGVLMLSILRFAPPQQQEKLRFHVLSDDLDDADKALLKGIAASREGTEVAFYEPAKTLSKETLGAIESTLRGRVTKETYYTVLIADMLPPDVKRAVYLDGDVVCTGDLGGLFDIDLKGCPCAMAPEADSIMHTCNRLGYPLEDGYFNLGVMLVDLCLWRKENLSKAMFDWLAANSKKLVLLAQDLICAVLHGRILPLDYSYNVMARSLYVFYWVNGEECGWLAERKQFLPKSEWPALLAAAERPRFVHATCLKPWFRESDWPFAPVWRYFYAASPWANEPLQWRNPPTAKARIKRLGRRALERLNLIAPQPAAGTPYPQEAYASGQRVLDELISRQSTVGRA